MKYEIYIQEPKKSQKFCKKAIAEYENRGEAYTKRKRSATKEQKRIRSSGTQRASGENKRAGAEYVERKIQGT